MSKEKSMRLAAAMNNKKFDDFGSAEVLITATNANPTCYSMSISMRRSEAPMGIETLHRSLGAPFSDKSKTRC
jgi:hypothetical protein